MKFMQLPSVMDGSYLDRMTVGEMKQHTDDLLTNASRELKEKAVQQIQENLRFVSRKGTMIRANKKWISARKEKGRSIINAVNTIPIQSPSSRPDIFVFRLTKEHADSHTVLVMTRTSACPTLTGRMNHTKKRWRERIRSPGD